MSPYKNTPLHIGTLRKQVIIKRLPILVICIIIAFGVAGFSMRGVQIDLLPCFLLFAIVFMMFVYNTVKAIKQYILVYNSYELIIGDDFILRKQSNLPDVNLPFNDIVQIAQTAYGNLIVKSTATAYIIIPPSIDEYELVKAELATIQPITEQIKKPWQKLMWLVPAGVMGLMAGVYISNNKAIVSVSGAILAALLSWSFYKIKANSALDKRLKSSLWTLPIVLLSIIAVVYYKVFVK